MSHKPNLIVSSSARSDNAKQALDTFKSCGRFNSPAPIDDAAIAKIVSWCLEKNVPFSLEYCATANSGATVMRGMGPL